MGRSKKLLLIALSAICLSCVGVAMVSCGASAEDKVYYVLNKDEQSYSAVGVSEKAFAFKRDVVIADTYNNLPVTRVRYVEGYENFKSATSITIPQSVTSIGNSAFRGCEKLKEVVVPQSVTEIGSFAFANCKKLKSVTIEGAVTFSDDGGIFYKCSALQELSVPSVSEIPPETFYYCEKLTDVTLPENCTSIGEKAFYDCSSLTSIDLPENLETIGKNAFDQCGALKELSIPKKVSSIGSMEFYGCDSLEAFVVQQGNEYFSSIDGVLFDRNGTELLRCPEGEKFTSYTIPNGVTTIGKDAFHHCKKLKDIQIPTSVVSIGNNAFVFCESLQAVYLPKNMEYVGDNAFGFCYSLTTISLPRGEEFQSLYMVDGCKKLKTVIYPGPKAEWTATDNVFWNNQRITVYCTDGNIQL
jgi:hypothetical protein